MRLVMAICIMGYALACSPRGQKCEVKEGPRMSGNTIHEAFVVPDGEPLPPMAPVYILGE